MTVETPANRRPRKHYAIYVYAPGTSPKDSEPVAVSLCPTHRSLREPLSRRWQAVTCQQCIGVRKTLGL